MHDWPATAGAAAFPRLVCWGLRSPWVGAACVTTYCMCTVQRRPRAVRTLSGQQAPLAGVALRRP
eukprot:8555157-Alexandrium_andersonii.AAC.1